MAVTKHQSPTTGALELAEELRSIRAGVDAYNPDARTAARSAFAAAEQVWKLVPKIIEALSRPSPIAEPQDAFAEDIGAPVCPTCKCGPGHSEACGAEPQDSDAAWLRLLASRLGTWVGADRERLRAIAARLEAPNVEALIGQSSESDELTDEYLNALHASVKVPDNLTPIDRSEGDVVPVAWRWRYVDPRGPRHWVVRQSPLESHDAAPGYCALEVEPLYTRAARLEAPIAEDALVESDDLRESVERLICENRDAVEQFVAVQEALRNPATVVRFRAGFMLCREYMARFVEQGGDASTAASIRANWIPHFGDDPGQPRRYRFDELAKDNGAGGWDALDVDASKEAMCEAAVLMHALGLEPTEAEAAALQAIERRVRVSASQAARA